MPTPYYNTQVFRRFNVIRDGAEVQSSQVFQSGQDVPTLDWESPQASLREVINLGRSTDNPLLLDYCNQLLETVGHPIPTALDRRRQTLTAMTTGGSLVRWLDTALTDHDTDIDPLALLESKIDRTLKQIRNLESGSGYMCYVLVPAQNEEDAVGGLIDSLRSEVTGVPVGLIVADNNSTDGTAKVVQGRGGNVIKAEKPGVGPTRQRAIDHALRVSPVGLDRLIFLQTDADCTIESGCIDSVVAEYVANPELQVGVGPSIYTMQHENGSMITLTSGRDHAELLGTSGLRVYFNALRRDPADYMLRPPFRYLVGPNTSFRAAALAATNVRYPEDGRWETMDLSIRLQQQLPGDTAIRYIPKQSINVSPRAILGGADRLTTSRIAEIRSMGYVAMYNGNGVSITPKDTVRRVVAELDSATYNLNACETVAAIVDVDAVPPNAERVTPALHAATGEPILGKVAIIAKA